MLAGLPQEKQRRTASQVSMRALGFHGSEIEGEEPASSKHESIPQVAEEATNNDIEAGGRQHGMEEAEDAEGGEKEQEKVETKDPRESPRIPC